MTRGRQAILARQHPKIYGVWANMKSRCLNPSNPAYHRYGGRGIKVDSSWLQFPAFLEWALSSGYAEGLAIDRKNNNGSYEPSNCRWVTSKVNGNNRRSCVYLTAFGVKKTLSEWVDDERCSISGPTLRYRLAFAWEPEDAITIPPLHPQYPPKGPKENYAIAS